MSQCLDTTNHPKAHRRSNFAMCYINYDTHYAHRECARLIICTLQHRISPAGSSRAGEAHNSKLTDICNYRSALGKRPFPGKYSYTCTSLQGVYVAASIQMYGNYILGKPPCGPKSFNMGAYPGHYGINKIILQYNYAQRTLQ